MLSTKRINRVKVKVIPKDSIPLEHIKGNKLFDEPYANIFILAKKNSGKTTVEYNILTKCINKNTTVVIFAGQLYKDASYKYIVDWLKKKNIPFLLNNSISDEEGQNQLKELLDYLRNEYKEEYSNLLESDDESSDKYNEFKSLYPDDSSDEEDDIMPPNSKIKPSKKRKLCPDYVFIFDDLSEEIRASTQIASLLKTNRHYKSKVIICSQYLNDLRPEAISNLDYLLMFRKIPVKKVEEVHQKLNLDLPLPLFKDVYSEATAKPHNFLYIDIKNDKYRKNFDEEFELEDG
jgi:hypothetical protein